MSAFFATFQAKDWLTLIGTVVALLFSLLTYFQKRSESIWSNRKQLSEEVARLTELNIELAKFRASPEESKLPQNYPILLNDQRRYLVRHAVDLANQIGASVSTHEHLTIAWALDLVDDVASAKIHFERAINKRTDYIENGLAHRSYARFLEKEGEGPLAEKEYAAALKAFSGAENDRARFYRGDTYERRALEARDRGDQLRATEFFEKAREYYQLLTDQANRKRRLDRLSVVESAGQPSA